MRCLFTLVKCIKISSYLYRGIEIKKIHFLPIILQDSRIPMIMNVALVTILVKDLTKFPVIMAVVDVGTDSADSLIRLLRTIVNIQVDLSHGLELLKDACVNVKYLQVNLVPDHPIHVVAKYLPELMLYVDRQNYIM